MWDEKDNFTRDEIEHQKTGILKCYEFSDVQFNRTSHELILILC